MLIFFAIILMSFLAGAEIDICVSSLPEIRKLFNISYFQAELILGLNLLFHCISAFIIGLFGDKYKKENIIQIGMFFFIISSFGCAISNNFYILIFWRIMQGISIAAPMVLSTLLIFEYFEEKKQSDMMTKLHGFATIGVSIAPLIGSYLTLISWRLNFLFLALIGFISIFIFRYAISKSVKISEQVQNNKEKAVTLKDYLPIFKSKMTMIFIFTACTSIAAYYSFVGMSSMIYVEGFGVDVRHFGFYQGSLVLAFGVFSMLNQQIINLIGKKNLLKISLALIFLFLIGNCFVIVLNIKNANIITPLLICWSIGVVHPVNIIYMKTLNYMKNANSRVNALLTLFKWLFSIAGFQIASYFFTGDFRVNGIIILIFYFFVLNGWYFLHKKERIFD